MNEPTPMDIKPLNELNYTKSHMFILEKQSLCV